MEFIPSTPIITIIPLRAVRSGHLNLCIQCSRSRQDNALINETIPGNIFCRCLQATVMTTMKYLKLESGPLPAFLFSTPNAQNLRVQVPTFYL